MRKLFFGALPLLLSQNLYAHGISDSAKQAMLDGGYLQYLWLGAEHMITGYDHLLFLFGVIFFLTTFKDIVKFITVFTIAHCITLIFATYLGITANYFLVDAVIALSVCYKGFDNNGYFKSYLGMEKSPSLIGMVFAFGLIHGFGLSTRLQQLPLGEKGSAFLGRILSFNVGVEVGQIAALVVMLLLLSGVRKTDLFKKLSRVANDLLIIAGALLFLMQMHGYLHTKYPDDHGFSKDEHIHHHEDMNADHGHDSL